MALRKAIIIDSDGLLKQLPAGDTLAGPVAEVDVISSINDNLGAITLGQAVYVSSAGSVDLARSDAVATSKVVGLVSTASIPAAASGNIQTNGVLASSNWTAVVGAATLVPGTKYFLDKTTAGHLTAVSPDPAVDTGKFVVCVGVALSTTEIQINPEPPIGL